MLRVQVKARTDGAAGWVTISPTAVKRWTGIYKCAAALPLQSSCKVEGAEELRSLTVREMLEIQAESGALATSQTGRTVGRVRCSGSASSKPY